MDLYEELGVPKNASPEEIKAAHRKAVKNHHPDRGGDKHKFQHIQLAYDTLKNEERRKHYDRTGETGHAQASDPVIQAIATIFQGMVAEMLGGEGLDIETSDIGEMAKDAMDKKLMEVTAERESKERQLKRAGVLVKRWKRKRKAKGFDMIGDTLRRAQRDIQEQVDKLKGTEEIWKQARKILNDYSYKFDEKGPEAWAENFGSIRWVINP